MPPLVRSGLERSRSRTARTAMWVVLATFLAAGAAAEGVRVEPQIGPHDPRSVELHPTAPFLLLVVEGDGKVGLWDVEDKRDYVRLLTIYTNAADACFSADGESIVTGGRDGRIRLWDRNGALTWETEDAHDGGVTVAASSDVLASAGDGGAVRLWNPDGSARGESLKGHEGRAPSLSFSPTGAVLASAGDDGMVRLWNLEMNGSARSESLWDHEGSVWSVSFSPSEDVLASAGADGAVRLWNLDGSAHGEPLRGHKGDVWSVSFSPTGDLASAGADGTVRLWNLDGSARGEPLRGHENGVSSVSFSVTGGTLASAGADGMIRLWSLDGGARGGPLRGHEGSVYSVSLSPTGDILASAGDDGTVRLWSLDGKVRSPPLRGHEGRILSLSFSPAGNVLASAGADGTIRLWNLDGSARGEPLRGHEGTVWSTSFSPVEDILASAGADGTIRLWNLDGSARGGSLSGHEGSVLSTSFSPAGDVLASAGADGTVRLWNLDGSARGEPLQGHEGSIYSVSFSPTGDFLAAADLDGTIRSWNLDGSARGEPLQGHEGWVSSLSFSPTEDILASAGADGTIRLWNLDGSTRGESLRGHEGSVWSVAFSPTGDVLVSAGLDGTIRLWNMDWSARGEPLQRHENSVLAVAFSPAANFLASAGADGAIRLWSLDGSVRGEPFRGHEGRVLSVSFSPGGDVLASAGDDGSIRLWNLEGIARSEILRGHAAEVNSVSFSPTEDILASAGADGTVRLWNLDGSTRGEPLRGHEGWVRSVSFSPAGDILASAGDDGTIRLWNLEGNIRGEPLRGHTNHIWSLSFSPAGDVLASSGDDGTVLLWKLGGGTPTELILKAPGASLVGFFESSLYTLSPGSTLTFFDRELQPLARMTFTAQGTLVSTPVGWYHAADALFGGVRLFSMGDENPLPQRVAVETYHRPEEIVATLRGRAWWQRLRAKTLGLWRQATTWYAGLPKWGKAAFWPATSYVVLALAIAATFLIRPAVLAGLTMPSLTRPDLSKWKSIAQALTLVRFFGETQRALDAWLRTHEEELYERVFAGRESVEARHRYVDLGNQNDLAAWQGDAISGKRAACWITGPGGCGKSTLAFRMARILHDDASRHPVLPIVVEEDWDGSFMDHLGERLLIADRRPSSWMVTKLAHTGRLVAIVDGLSERRLADAAEQVTVLWRRGIFRYLLLTSRSDMPSGAEFRKIEVGPLDVSRLASFVGAHVTEGEVLPVVEALSAFGRGEPIRPLFARLAIEQLGEDGELPSTFVGLVDRYLRRLRPPSFHEAGFLHAARKAAEASVENDLAPRAVDEGYLRGFLASDGTFSGDGWTPELVIDHLVRCGLLERVEELSTNRVRFVDDPIAELLYAKSLVDQGGAKLRKLRRRLTRGGDAVRGLCEALEQVETS